MCRGSEESVTSGLIVSEKGVTGWVGSVVSAKGGPTTGGMEGLGSDDWRGER
jgi:hypothetical protein